MKKGLLVIMTGVMLFASLTIVNAESQSDTITNRSGVVIPIEKYNALKSIYSNNFMEFMTQDQYDIIKDKDLSKVEIMETTDEDLNASGISPQAQEYTTTSKSLRIVNNNGYITMTLTWLKVPSIKKYDVMAFRLNSSVTRTSGYAFRQYYVYNNVLDASTATYPLDFDNGSGVTFKVHSGTDHQMELSFNVTGTGRVYGSYQHACNSSATLANAMDYIISGSGYGGVILFNERIESKFDGMGGVYLTI